jgi:hypothetical protein
VSAARETVAAIVVEREPRLFGRCVYCSRPCTGLACSGHRDLLWNDDHYYVMRLPQPKNATDQAFVSRAENPEGAHST